MEFQEQVRYEIQFRNEQGTSRETRHQVQLAVTQRESLSDLVFRDITRYTEAPSSSLFASARGGLGNGGGCCFFGLAVNSTKTIATMRSANTTDPPIQETFLKRSVTSLGSASTIAAPGELSSALSDGSGHGADPMPKAHYFHL